MKDDNLFRKPSISVLLSGAVIDSAVEAHCLHLGDSGNLLLRMAALGFLLDPDLPTDSVGQQRQIHTRIECLIALMPRKFLHEIENLAGDELNRLIIDLRDTDQAMLDAVKLLEINAQRDLLEAVNRLLQHAKRPYVEHRLNELDRLIPPEIEAVIAKRSYF